MGVAWRRKAILRAAWFPFAWTGGFNGSHTTMNRCSCCPFLSLAESGRGLTGTRILSNPTPGSSSTCRCRGSYTCRCASWGHGQCLEVGSCR